MSARWRLLAAAALLLGLSPGRGAAQCVGNCGTLGPDGVVAAPPGFGAYGWVSTLGGNPFGGLDGIALPDLTTNASRFLSAPFTANAGDALEFWFNYVTSDGDVYTDYAWARLVHPDGVPQAAPIFTARTTPDPGGSTVPGFGMPALDPATTLTPSTVGIAPGFYRPDHGPVWSPLGGSSGTCWEAGCGFTGWVQSVYEVGATGTYRLEFGVANWLDELWDSGLAYQGVRIAGTPVPSTPGESEDLPIMPDQTIDDPLDDLPPVFVFTDVPSDLWFDPMLADGYDFVSTGGSLFTEIMLPTGFAAPFQVYVGPTFSDLFGSFLGGTEVDFTSLGVPGVDRFRVAGITPPIADATHADAFPTQIAFTRPFGNSFTMTPVLVATAAPEPGSVALLGTGLVALLGAVRARRRVRR